LDETLFAVTACVSPPLVTGGVTAAGAVGALSGDSDRVSLCPLEFSEDRTLPPPAAAVTWLLLLWTN